MEYKYLEPWRDGDMKVKGRRVYASSVIYSKRANRQTDEECAEDKDLPLEVVQECVQWWDDHGCFGWLNGHRWVAYKDGRWSILRPSQ